MKDKTLLEEFKKIYPEKFASEDEIFSHIHAGDRIFIGTGCGEPQYLVQPWSTTSRTIPRHSSMPS